MTNPKQDVDEAAMREVLAEEVGKHYDISPDDVLKTADQTDLISIRWNTAIAAMRRAAAPDLQREDWACERCGFVAENRNEKIAHQAGHNNERSDNREIKRLRESLGDQCFAALGLLYEEYRALELDKEQIMPTRTVAGYRATAIARAITRIRSALNPASDG